MILSISWFFSWNLVWRKKTQGIYRCAILINICIACSLYKLIHGAKDLQCSDMFVTRMSIIHLVLQEFVFSMNKVFGVEIKWLGGEDLVQVMATFKNFCGLLVIYDAWTSFKFTYKNQEVLLKVTIFHKNLDPTTCNFK